MQNTTENQSSWLERSPVANAHLRWELVIFAVLILLAIVTRFYLLEPRVMSHDENSHVYYSWLLYKGSGYAHDPVTHGPFQFHAVALAYLLFSDTDTVARIPAVLFSIASVWFIWYFRRYMGKTGALITSFLIVISPYMLYYARYVRNESFVVLWGLIMLWAVLRYLEVGQARYLLWLTAAIVLHLTTKETAYMYVAELLVFLALYFIYRVTSKPWRNPDARTWFLVSLVAAVALGGVAVGIRALAKASPEAAAAVESGAQVAVSSGTAYFTLILLALAGVAIFAAFYFLLLGHTKDDDNQPIWYFMLSLAAIPLLLGATLAYGIWLGTDNPILNMMQPVAGMTATAADNSLAMLAFGLALVVPIALGVALFFLGRYLMKLPASIWPVQEGERSLDIILLVSSLMLPSLAAFLIDMIGTPTDYSITGMVKSGTVLIPIAFLSVGIGLGWCKRLWLPNAGLFYGIFVVLYTTFFTNGQGFFTGLIGGLGYWLEQQGVNRGSQPWYYYGLIQIPFYEFLPAIGVFLAVIYIIVKRVPMLTQPAEAQPAVEDEPTAPGELTRQAVPFLPLILFWTFVSLIAFSYAGEKMPWLTVHIALPMILVAGWFLGQMVDGIDWGHIREQRGLLMLLVLIIFVVSFAGVIAQWVANPPFQGQELAQLQGTATFLTSLVVAVVSGIILFRLLKEWQFGQIVQLIVLAVFGLLAFLTARSAFLASYVNYDEATELLVYAHSAPGVKIALNQIEDISKRLTGSLDVQIAFDNVTTYPYWWYLRNYPNQYYYGTNPGRDLRDYPLILVGDENFSKIEPVVGKAFEEFDYTRIWWPNQDYFNLTPARMWDAITNPRMRAALFDIWFYRDYKKYSEISSEINGYPVNLSLSNWSPSGQMRLYIRKDIVAQLWDYGAAPVALEDLPELAGLDEAKQINLSADFAVGAPGSEDGQFINPRGLAVAPDDSIYVADSSNHRIQHLSPDGEVLSVWGEMSPAPSSDAPDGTFTEPWDVAVGPDGSVYVADTWNHRIQKFTADGEFVTKWGYGINQDLTDPYGFYGPRGIAVDQDGQVYVSDTGNKRIIVYSPEGEFITQTGEGGFGPGQFNEPVGISLDPAGTLYVADTWNQRIQSLLPNGQDGFTPLLQWDVDGWYGKSLNNYPYITNAENGHLFITDPEAPRIIEYTSAGELVRYWGLFGADLTGLNLPTGISTTEDGGLWVVDSGNGRILYFTLPSE